MGAQNIDSSSSQIKTISSISLAKEVHEHFQKSKLKDLLKDKKVVVFSPHLDDAALSMGSLLSYLLEQEYSVRVISLFTAGSKLISPSVQTILGRTSFDDVQKYFEARKSEDIAALKELGKGVEILHLNLVDAAWREHKSVPLYPNTQLAKLHAVDGALYEKLKNIIKEIINTSGDAIFFGPLGRGEHADHQLVRNAIISNTERVIFYEDFPYSALYPNADSFIKENGLTSLDWMGNYELKKRSILLYRTQKRALFDKGPMTLPLEKYFYIPAVLLRV